MLTSDAFLSGAGEMDRLRSSNLPQSASSKKANTEKQGAASGVSFPQALKSVQDAQDSGGVSGTAAEAAVEGDTSSATAIAEGKAASKPLDAAISKKAAHEDDVASADALYANLFAGDAVAVASELIADDVLLEAGEGANLSSIITAITADIEGESAALPSLIAEGSGEEAAAVLDERMILAKSATAAESRVDAEKSAPDVNLSSINMDESEAAVAAASDADALEGAFADIGNLAQAGEGRPERASLAQEGDKSAVAAGNGKGEAAEDAAAFTVADFRTGAEKANVASRNSVDAKDAETSSAIALANSQGTDAAQSSADFSFEGDGLLGNNTGSGFSLQELRSSEGALGGTQGPAGASFAERLASELRNNAADIVRAGQIILRNAGEGTIRLALHPETLGAVRIHLEMTGEKKIAGRITVSSREAWDAFSESIDSLIAAFSDEGFDTGGGFDLSWAGRGAGGEAGGKVSAPFYASATPDVMPANDFADNYSTATARRSAGSLYSVDLFA